MSQSAVAEKYLGSGREQRTDGLWKHLGTIDGGSLRAVDNMTPTIRTGAGLEVVYDRPSQTGYLVSFDRELSLYRDLNIAGKNINLQPLQGGTLGLPAGSVTTPAIAANAVQQLIGSFVGASGWAATAPAAWNESAVQVTVTCSGAPCRIEFCISISANTATAYSRVGIGMDGGILAALLTNHYPTANMIQALSCVYYVTPSAGPHRFAVFVLPNTGIMTLDGGTTHTLFVTEQKR